MANLAATFVIQSDRYSDEVVLAAGNDNLNSGEDNNVTLSLPAGFGDCLLLDLQVAVFNIETAFVSTNVYSKPAVAGYVLDLASNVRDFLGVAELMTNGLYAAGTSGQTAYLNPAQPVLVREVGERLFLYTPAIDNGASDTSDQRYYVRVKRLRNTGVSVMP